MTEKYQPIPHRLKNMAVGGHVAGAVDILDDKKGKNQEVINEETDDSIALLQAAYRALTQSDVIPGELPVTGEANKIYRVPGEDSYTDYMWDGTDFVPMATYDNGVDEEPSDSDNVIKSRAVFKGMEYNDSYLSKLSIVDDEGNVVGYITTDDILKLFVGIDVPSINGFDINNYQDFTVPYNTLVDADNNIIAYIEDGIIKLISFDIVSSEDKSKSDIIARTYGIKSDIMSFAKLGSVSTEQFIVNTDNHHRTDSLDDMKTLITYLGLPFGIHLGDFVNRLNLNSLVYAASNIMSFQYPIICSIGNHDVGESSVCVENCCSSKKIYELFVDPLKAVSGINYIEDKPYFYYDRNGIRYIVLYDYDDNESFDETYWKAITYDASYPLIETGTEYVTGSKINVADYNEYSFEAVQDVTPTPLKHNKNRNNTQPCYKAYRGYLWYSSEQLLWLCNSLKSATDEGLKVVILKHMPFTSNATVLENDYVSPYYTSDLLHPRDFRYLDEDKDIVPAIVNAWLNKTTINKTIEPQSSYVNQVYDDNNNLIRELYDDCSSLPNASIEYDFSSMDNDPVFKFYMFGHSHADYMIQHNEYNQIGICFNGSLYKNPSVQDIKTFNDNSLIGDKQTVLTFIDESHVVFDRIGTSKAVHGNRIIDKRNLIINF